MTVLDDIRAATRRRHNDLENGSNIVERLLNPLGRREVLGALYSLHQEAERVLLPWLAPVADLHYEERLKLRYLAHDLKALGVSLEDLPSGSPAPHLASRAEALGFGYVLEGATLGGRVIARRLSTAGVTLAGTSFFDVYGAAAGVQWKAFCTVLERECLADPAAAVGGACAGFDFMREGLRPGGKDHGLPNCVLMAAAVTP